MGGLGSGNQRSGGSCPGRNDRVAEINRQKVNRQVVMLRDYMLVLGSGSE